MAFIYMSTKTKTIIDNKTKWKINDTDLDFIDPNSLQKYLRGRVDLWKF